MSDFEENEKKELKWYNILTRVYIITTLILLYLLLFGIFILDTHFWITYFIVSLVSLLITIIISCFIEKKIKIIMLIIFFTIIIAAIFIGYYIYICSITQVAKLIINL